MESFRSSNNTRKTTVRLSHRFLSEWKGIISEISELTLSKAIIEVIRYSELQLLSNYVTNHTDIMRIVR